MLYRLLKIWVWLGSRIFCRKIIVNRPKNLKLKGPLLLAVNHPNSFLDAVMLDILFREPIWSLARGDVFKKPFYIWLLKKLKILPVFRTSEGVENLEINYKTFEICKTIFRNNGIVQVFSEGKCVNEWHLRPLKKGTARLAFGSWQEGIDVRVLPVGINYSSFRRFGKNIFLNFGDIISKKDFDMDLSDGKMHLEFNNKLQYELTQLVYEIPKDDHQLQKKKLKIKPGLLLKIVLLLPALIGYLVHAPLYVMLHSFTMARTRNNDHFDSIINSLLIFLYPFYLVIISVLLFVFTGNWFSFLLLVVLPFSAWSYTQLKGQLDKIKK